MAKGRDYTERMADWRKSCGHAGEPLTSSEVYNRMQGNVDMSMRMVRVLMNRLNQKDILGYTVDEHDSRVYHYYVQRSREECVKEKSRKFVDSYFSGSGTNAMAALLQSFALTDEQIKELGGDSGEKQGAGTESTDKEGGEHV